MCTNTPGAGGTLCPPTRNSKPETRRGTAKECAQAGRFAGSELNKWASKSPVRSAGGTTIVCDQRRKRADARPEGPKKATTDVMTGLCDSVMRDNDTSNDHLCLPIGSPGTCEDITSIDGNFYNDVRCTREDGSKFLTNYAGATAFLRAQ